MKTAITTRKDPELFVNGSSEEVRENKALGYIFDDVAEFEWETHLPKMYSFGSAIQLSVHRFSENPMQKHIALRKQTAMTDKEFSEWLHLFIETADDLFFREKVNEAKLRAENSARLMLHNIQTV